MVYAVVLFTLVIQGLSLRPALAALALTRREPDKSGANHERKGAHRLLR